MSAVSRRPKGVISSGKEFNSFEEFFPFYMQEHSNRTNRRLHFIGTSLALLSLAILTFLGLYKFLFAPFVLGYGFAWVLHAKTIDKLQFMDFIYCSTCSSLLTRECRLVTSSLRRTSPPLSSTLSTRSYD
jgi:hypothetical protein